MSIETGPGSNKSRHWLSDDTRKGAYKVHPTSAPIGYRDFVKFFTTSDDEYIVKAVDQGDAQGISYSHYTAQPGDKRPVTVIFIYKDSETSPPNKDVICSVTVDEDKHEWVFVSENLVTGVQTTQTFSLMDFRLEVASIMGSNLVLEVHDEDGNVKETITIDMSSFHSIVNDLNTSTDTKPIADHLANGITTVIEETVTHFNQVAGELVYTNENGVDEKVLIPKIDNVLTCPMRFDYTDSLGVTTTISETVISASYDNLAHSITITAEDCNDIVLPLNVGKLEQDSTCPIVLKYTDEKGAVTTVASETVTTVADIAPVPNTSSKGLLYTAEDCNTTQWFESLTTLIQDAVATHMKYSYTNESGAVVTFEETITSLLMTAGYELEYTKEDGTKDIVDLSEFKIVSSGLVCSTGILTFNFDDGSTHVVDLSALKSAITPVVTVGQTIATHNDGCGTVTDIKETVTLLQNLIAGHKIGDYTDEAGNNFVINETITDLLYNPVTHVLTYNKEDGTQTVIDLSALAVDININGASYDATSMALTLTDTSGETFVIDLSTLASKVTDSVTNPNKQIVAVHDSGNGTTSNIYESIVQFTDNANGTFTIITEDLTSTTFSADAIASSAFTCADGTLRLTKTSGAVLAIDLSDLKTSVVANPDGSFTINFPCGSSETIPAETVTVMANTLATGNKIGDYTNEANAVVDINESITTITNTVTGNKIGDYTAEGGAVTPINETITAVTNTITGKKIADYTDESGGVTAINETITTLVDNNDGTLTYTSEDGSTTVIDLNIDVNVANLSYDNVTKVITLTETDSTIHTINISDLIDVETVTTITNTVAGNKIADYTNENGAVVPINETVTGVTNTVTGHKIGDYTNESGAVQPINETVTGLALVGSNLEYTKEDGTKDIVAAGGGNTSIVTQVLNPNLAEQTIAVHQDGGGNTVNIQESVTTMVLDDPTNPTKVTYTSEDGTVTEVPLCEDVEVTTLTALRSLATGSNLNMCKVYSFPITQAGGGGSIFLRPLAKDKLPSNVNWHHPTKTGYSLWPAHFDVQANDLQMLHDPDRNNTVYGEAAINNFTWDSNSVTNNLVKNARVNYTGGNFSDNEIYSSATVTVSGGNFQRNVVKQNANVTVSAGDFRNNNIENDATVTSSTSGDIEFSNFMQNSNSTFSGTANFDECVVGTDSNVTQSAGTVYEGRILDSSTYIHNGGNHYRFKLENDAQVTINANTHYDNNFDNSILVNQVGTQYIRYSTFSGSVSMTIGDTYISNSHFDTCDMNTTNSIGYFINSNFRRTRMLACQNCPQLYISESDFSGYSEISITNATRLYIYRSQFAGYGRALVSTGSRVDVVYSRVSAGSYVQSTVSGGFLSVSYSDITARGYASNQTANTNYVYMTKVTSNSNLRFLNTANNCRVYYSTIADSSTFYANGTSNGCYFYYSTVTSGSTLRCTNSVNLRCYQQSLSSRSQAYSQGCNTTHYMYYNNCSSGGILYMLNNGTTSNRLYSINVDSQSICRISNATANTNLYYSSFGSYYYFYLIGGGGTRSGYRGYGRRTYTVNSSALPGTGTFTQNF